MTDASIVALKYGWQLTRKGCPVAITDWGSIGVAADWLDDHGDPLCETLRDVYGGRILRIAIAPPDSALLTLVAEVLLATGKREVWEITLG